MRSIREAAWARFHSFLSNLEGPAMLHGHRPWGSFPWSLPAGRQVWLPHPYLSYLLCRSFSICGRTVVHRSSFHRELGRGPGMRALSARPCPLPPPTTPTPATYAFWLTMLRRSTTTDRSLMATAESTDVCANRAPVRGDRGLSGPAWVWRDDGIYCGLFIRLLGVVTGAA